MPVRTSVVLTIGHSTRTLETFLHLLQVHRVTRLVDVRKIPRSRHNPQFNEETLPDALNTAGLSYQHMAGLGGLRHTRPDSPNKAWRNASFRGFADYMQTPEFEENLQVLMDVARQERVALMCRRGGALAVPSLAHCRCVVGAGPAGRTHHERNPLPEPFALAVGPSEGNGPHLSARAERGIQPIIRSSRQLNRWIINEITKGRGRERRSYQ